MLDVDILAVRDGALIRLGLVTAKTSETFQLPDVLRRYSGDLRFLVDPVGSTAAYLSDPVRVAPGDLIELRVGARFQQSSISVH